MQLNFEYLPEYKPIHISNWNICICSLFLLYFEVFFIRKSNTVFENRFCYRLLCITGSVLVYIQFYQPSHFTVSGVTAINVMVQLFSHLSSTIIKKHHSVCVLLLQYNNDDDPSWYAGSISYERASMGRNVHIYHSKWIRKHV